MKKLVYLALAVLTALGASGCSEKNENKQIEVPIYEAKSLTYNTAKAEVTEIAEHYALTGKYSYPYSLKVKFGASAQINEIFVASGEEVKKGQLLCSLFTDDIDDRIEKKKAYVDQAQKTYSKLLSTYNGSNINEIEIARVDYEIQKYEYDELVKSRDSYNVYAPCDGHFRSVSNNWGQKLDKYVSVNQGTTFGTVTDESESFLTCTMREQPLSNVNFGTHVNITQGDKASGGIVADIIKDNNDYIYVIRPDKDADFMKIGEMMISFNIYSRKDVVVVPNEAVKKVGQRKFVNLLVDGVKIEQDVETGIVDGSKVEITGGLTGGEELILN